MSWFKRRHGTSIHGPSPEAASGFQGKIELEEVRYAKPGIPPEPKPRPAKPRPQLPDPVDDPMVAFLDTLAAAEREYTDETWKLKFRILRGKLLEERTYWERHYDVAYSQGVIGGINRSVKLLDEMLGETEEEMTR